LKQERVLLKDHTTPRRHAVVLRLCIPFDVARLKRKKFPGEIVLKSVADGGAVQVAEAT
jgi:hypothetical protein